MMRCCLVIFAGLILSCNDSKPVKQTVSNSLAETEGCGLIILGTVQDAGSPHIACRKSCCSELFKNPDPTRRIVSLGVYDADQKKSWLFEASPDIAAQLKLLKSASGSEKELPDGLLLTHAHIGHYSGLMYLGREACNADKVPVYAMPRMNSFLNQNGPWSQLLSLNNIILNELIADKVVSLSEKISVKPVLVPHRDEFSETIGFIISGPKKKILFIPDIDKWSKWNYRLSEILDSVDYAFLDATFYSGTEIKQRDISLIPHPFVIETMEMLKEETAEKRRKVWFIHLNHTNPLLNKNSQEYKSVLKAGFNIAAYGMRFEI